MNTAQERAREVRLRHNLQSPSDLERVLAAENMEVIRFPLEGRLDEIIVYNFVAIRDSIEDPRKVFELLAHALAHHLLHAGNQMSFILPSHILLSDQMERQAWDFAFELLMPAALIEARLREGWGHADLQEDFQVRAEFVQRRLEAFRRDYEMEHLNRKFPEVW